MDDQLPDHVKYWLEYSKKDCFFNVGPPTGPNERIGAIKIFLMGHSEPLCRMLEESDMAEKGDICLPDIEPKCFKDFLMCVYGGSDVMIKRLNFEECAKLLYIAEKYLVARLKQEVLTEMVWKMPLSINNVFVAFENSVCLQDHILSSAVAKVISNETDKIFADKRFLDISSEALLLIVKQESLNSKEVNIFKEIIKWGINKANRIDGILLRDYIIEPLQFIRFRTISCEEFCREIIPVGVLSAEEACKMCVSIATKKPHGLALFSDNDNLRSSKILHQGIEPLVYAFNVENISSNEGQKQYSTYTKINGYSLRLFVKYDGDYLSLFLDVKHSSRTSWECEVAADLILVNQLGLTDLKRNTVTKYNEKNHDWGYVQFQRWIDVIDPAQGYIKHGSIVVAACVTFL